MSRALLLVTAVACGCAPLVQRAAIAPIASVQRATPAPPGALAPQRNTGAMRQFVVRASDSTLEVTGSDIVTGAHLMRFGRWHGSFRVDPSSRPERPAGRLSLEVDVTTLESDSEMVTGFLRDELLEVDRHPRAHLDAAVRPRDDGESGHVVEGRLTIHGVERKIRFFADVRPAKTGYRIAAVFDMSRQEFDIRRHDGWDTFIHDDFRVVLALSARAEHVTVEVER